MLELAPAQVQDTLSFYGFFKQDKPHGLVRAWVCRSISCACAAARKFSTACATPPATHPGEATADGKLTIEFGECLGACEFAPCMLAGKTLYKNLTPELGEKIVAQCRPAASSRPKRNQRTDRGAVRSGSAAQTPRI